ncbi:MAG: HEAT repeat domain-containing protein [Myxococcales bacterium]|nr:HEAT repeat domain-containing protein [Myxococcales bacterium]
MPSILDIVAPQKLLEAARRRLARFAGDRPLLGSDDVHASSPPATLPVDPALRNTIAAQNADRTYTTARAWTLALEHTTSAWRTLADEELTAGRWLHAQAARAAAWALGDEARPDALAFDPDHDPRDARSREQPSRRANEQPWTQREWLAGASVGYGLVDLPTLVAWSADESFAVRTRVYRSLGKVRHIAALPTLREATRDPHPFSRAQAVRSLGWIGDVGATERLVLLARKDPSLEVQRSARVALERIVALWEHWGEWIDLARDADRAALVVKRLATLRAFGDVTLPVSHTISLGTPIKRVDGFRYDPAQWTDDASAEDRALDASRRDARSIVARIEDARARKDAPTLILLCATASQNADTSAIPVLRELTEHKERAVTFHARRALRALRARAP